MIDMGHGPISREAHGEFFWLDEITRSPGSRRLEHVCRYWGDGMMTGLSDDKYWPITSQYSGHVNCLDQSEVSIWVMTLGDHRRHLMSWSLAPWSPEISGQKIQKSSSSLLTVTFNSERNLEFHCFVLLRVQMMIWNKLDSYTRYFMGRCRNYLRLWHQSVFIWRVILCCHVTKYDKKDPPCCLQSTNRPLNTSKEFQFCFQQIENHFKR